ncbi:MAG: fibronectin type III domain-containing protein [Terracidiphilus sp.]
MTALAASSTLWSQTFPTQIGVEASDRPTGFIDAFKDQGRLVADSSGNPVPTDAGGNPLSDGTAVIFDDRPIFAWAPPIDDPAQYQPNCSGTYAISFTGQAVLANVAGNPVLTFSHQAYDAATNTTTVNVFLPGGPTYADGPALMVISFTNTQLTATSGTNTGLANLQVIRPGFTLAEAANPAQVFDPAFVAAFAPFAYIRFMGWLGTNNDPGSYSDPGHHLLPWSSRSLPTDFFQGVGANLSTNANIDAGAWGISWEYVVLLANAANKDVWLAIPVSATGGSDPLEANYVAAPDTSSYLYNLAMFLKNGDAFTGNAGLNPGLHIYLEHSNEVWNTIFGQTPWNMAAAEDEVAKGGSVLNNDGDASATDWAARRHIKRLYEIAQIFESVYGPGSFGTIIRPVYAWFELDEGAGSGADNALAWFNKTYGPPANYFVAMAQGDYFNPSNVAGDTTIAEVLADMTANSNADVAYLTADKATAAAYGLKIFAYEGGPANSGGSSDPTLNLGVQILANRDPGMDALVQTHIRNNWFGNGGGNFGYFAFSSAYSRYGSWGATDDYRNLTTPKYNALVNLTGYEPNGVPFSPGDLVATAGDASIALAWQPVPGATSYSVYRGTAAGAESTAAITATSLTSYTDSPLTNGTAYYYIVTGTNSNGASTPSNEARATPAAPPAFTAAGTSVSVEPGATSGNASTITLTPSNGFTGAVTLSAAVTTGPSDAVYPPTFSFGTTSPVNITSGAATGTLTVTTTASGSGPCTSWNHAAPSHPWHAKGGAMLACLVLIGIPLRRRNWRSFLAMLALFAILAGGVSACSGSSGKACTALSTSGTTAGTYTITVTGTSGSVTETGTVTLTVQQPLLP